MRRRLWLVSLGGLLLSCRPSASQPDSGDPERPTEYRGIAVAPIPSVSTGASTFGQGVVREDASREAEMALKRSLQQKLLDGGASDSDLRLLIAICKEVDDRACVEDAERAVAKRP